MYNLFNDNLTKDIFLPTNPDLQQGLLLFEQQQLEAALQCFGQALRNEPENISALHHAGLITAQFGNPKDTIRLLSKAEELDPNVAIRHIALAQAYRRLQQATQALQHVKHALLLDATEPDNHTLLGDLLADMGDLGDACITYLKALEIDADNISAYFGLAQLHAHGHYHFSQKQQTRLLHLCQNDQLPIYDRSKANFAMGRVLHKAGDYPAAFQHIHSANQLKRQTHLPHQRFDAAEQAQTLARNKTIFSVELLNRLKLHGSQSRLPIFVLGMPRTGSTLVEKILASHPLIQAHGELMHIKNIARKNLTRTSALPYPELMPELPVGVISAAANHYLSQVSSKPHDYQRIVDKMPTNFEMLGLIQVLFPQAFIIHTYRDPMDTLWSCYQQTLSAKFTYDFDDLVAKYRQYRQYMQLWNERLSLRILHLSYEDLVNNFTQRAQDLIEFVELEWDKKCLQFHQTETGTTTASRLQVRKPIYSSSIGAWRKYAEQLAPLREKLDDFYPDSE